MSDRGDCAETLQALGCHLAVVVLYVVRSLDVLSLSASICLSLPTKPGRSASGGNLHPQTGWPRRSCRNVTSFGLSSSGCVRRTIIRRLKVLNLSGRSYPPHVDHRVLLMVVRLFISGRNCNVCCLTHPVCLNELLVSVCCVFL